MEKIKTATGKVIDCDFAVTIPSPPQLFLNLYNITFVQAAAVFSNANETIQLWHENRYFAHYTKLLSVAQDGDMIQVTMSQI